ncbi:MAG: RidA family protein, partial [Limisphaerales bacterium]
MSASHSGGCQPEKPQPGQHREHFCDSLESQRLVKPGSQQKSLVTAGFSFVDLGESARLALMLTPQAKGSFAEQVETALETLDALLNKAERRMTVTSQTVFLRDAQTRGECEQLLSRYYGTEAPVTNFVLQPPCSGAGLALEAWAVAGPDVRIERFGPNAISVGYEGVRWVHCGGVRSGPAQAGVYAQTTEVLDRMQKLLVQAGSGFDQVVRTWFY